MRESKKATMKRHAKRRAYERYHLVLSTADLQEISRIITERKATIVVKQSLRVSVYRLDFKGTPVQVVYDHERKCIATFLPYDMKPFTAEERAQNMARREAAMRGDVQDDVDYGPLGGR